MHRGADTCNLSPILRTLIMGRKGSSIDVGCCMTWKQDTTASVRAGQYGRNEDKVLKCTNIPSDIDLIHNRRPKPSFGDIWSTARGPRPPPFSKKSQKKD